MAESCTGGLIAKLLTDAAGASDIFLEGIVTYHNKSKMKRLGVSQKTLSTFGAVSKQTALEMARGLKARLRRRLRAVGHRRRGPDRRHAGKTRGTCLDRAGRRARRARA